MSGLIDKMTSVFDLAGKRFETFYTNAANTEGGDYSQSAARGDYSQSKVTAAQGTACGHGYRAMVAGSLGNYLFTTEFNNEGNLINALSVKVDGKKIKPDQWYIVENGKWVAVDFTDCVFTYVISEKKNTKKLRTNNGDVLYLVADTDGVSAHGKTIKEARESLVYKKIAKFDGKLPQLATGKEWIGIYRAVTGACAEGVRLFVRETNTDLDKSYTPQEIGNLVTGRFGEAKFLAKLKESQASA
jgi:hypothetical protein